MDNSPSYLLFQLASNIVSPYQYNPLNINPLRDLLNRLVDFDRVRACTPILELSWKGPMSSTLFYKWCSTTAGKRRMTGMLPLLPALCTKGLLGSYAV